MMVKKSKRLLSLILTLTLVMGMIPFSSLNFSAFAAGNFDWTDKTNANGGVYCQTARQGDTLYIRNGRIQDVDTLYWGGSLKSYKSGAEAVKDRDNFFGSDWQSAKKIVYIFVSGEDKKTGSIGDYFFAGFPNVEEFTIEHPRYFDDWGVWLWYTSVEWFGRPIGSIGKGSFENCPKLTTIGGDSQNGYSGFECDGKSIPDDAFKGCPISKVKSGSDVSESFASIQLPNCKTIGNRAFEDANFKYIDLVSKKIKTIGDRAFANAHSEEESTEGAYTLTMPKTLTSVGNNAFEGCGESSADFSNVEKLESMGVGVFKNSDKLRSVTGLPSSLTVLPDAFFSGCSRLDTVGFKNANFAGFTNLGNDAFTSCSNLKKVVKGKENVEVPIFTDTLKTIGGAAFKECSNFAFNNNGKVDLTKVEQLGDFAFAGCSKIVSVDFGSNDNIKTIGERTFRGCSGLTTLKNTNKLISFGKEAFLYCNKLKFDELPSGVTTLGVGALNGCTAIEKLTLDKKVTVNDDSFANCSGLKELIFKSGSSFVSANTSGTYKENMAKAFRNVAVTKMTTDGKTDGVSFSDLANLLKVTELTAIPVGSAKDLGNEIFVDYTTVKTLNIDEKVESLGKWTFKNFPKLEVVNLNKVKTFGEASFYDCTALTNFTKASDNNDLQIDKGIVYTKHKDQNTYNGWKLERAPMSVTTGSLVVPSKLKEQADPTDADSNKVVIIADYAFYGCSINSAVVPDTVTELGSEAFKECKNLTSVTLSQTLAKLQYETFAGCEKLKSVYVPNSVTEVENNAFSNCKALEAVVFGNQTEKFGKDLFEGCSNGALKFVQIWSSDTAKLKTGTNATAFKSIPADTNLFVSASDNQEILGNFKAIYGTSGTVGKFFKDENILEATSAADAEVGLKTDYTTKDYNEQTNVWQLEGADEGTPLVTAADTEDVLTDKDINLRQSIVAEHSAVHYTVAYKEVDNSNLSDDASIKAAEQAAFNYVLNPTNHYGFDENNTDTPTTGVNMYTSDANTLSRGFVLDDNDEIEGKPCIQHYLDEAQAKATENNTTVYFSIVARNLSDSYDSDVPVPDTEWSGTKCFVYKLQPVQHIAIKAIMADDGAEVIPSEVKEDDYEATISVGETGAALSRTPITLTAKPGYTTRFGGETEFVSWDSEKKLFSGEGTYTELIAPFIMPEFDYFAVDNDETTDVDETNLVETFTYSYNYKCDVQYEDSSIVEGDMTTGTTKTKQVTLKANDAPIGMEFDGWNVEVTNQNNYESAYKADENPTLPFGENGTNLDTTKWPEPKNASAGETIPCKGYDVEANSDANTVTIKFRDEVEQSGDYANWTTHFSGVGIKVSPKYKMSDIPFSVGIEDTDGNPVDIKNIVADQSTTIADLMAGSYERNGETKTLDIKEDSSTKLQYTDRITAQLNTYLMKRTFTFKGWKIYDVEGENAKLLSEQPATVLAYSFFTPPYSKILVRPVVEENDITTLQYNDNLFDASYKDSDRGTSTNIEASGSEVPMGAVVTLALKSKNPKFDISDWEFTGISADKVTISADKKQIEFNMPSESVTAYATVKDWHTLTLKQSATTIDGNKVSVVENAVQGNSYEIDPVLNVGEEFKGWQVIGLSEINPEDTEKTTGYIANKDGSLTIVGMPDNDVTVIANNSNYAEYAIFTENAKVTGDKLEPYNWVESGLYKPGDTVQVKYSDVGRFKKFKSVSLLNKDNVDLLTNEAGKEIVKPVYNEEDASILESFTMPAYQVKLVVEYEAAFNINAPEDVTVKVNGEERDIENRFAYENEEVEVTAAKRSGYVFKNWTATPDLKDAEGRAIALDTETLTFVMPAEAANLDAVYNELHKVTVIDGKNAPKKETVECGEEFTVTSTLGDKFVSWSADQQLNKKAADGSIVPLTNEDYAKAELKFVVQTDVTVTAETCVGIKVKKPSQGMMKVYNAATGEQISDLGKNKKGDKIKLEVPATKGDGDTPIDFAEFTAEGVTLGKPYDATDESGQLKCVNFEMPYNDVLVNALYGDETDVYEVTTLNNKTTITASKLDGTTAALDEIPENATVTLTLADDAYDANTQQFDGWVIKSATTGEVVDVTPVTGELTDKTFKFTMPAESLKVEPAISGLQRPITIDTTGYTGVTSEIYSVDTGDMVTKARENELLAIYVTAPRKEILDWKVLDKNGSEISGATVDFEGTSGEDIYVYTFTMPAQEVKLQPVINDTVIAGSDNFEFVVPTTDATGNITGFVPASYKSAAKDSDLYIRAKSSEEELNKVAINAWNDAAGDYTTAVDVAVTPVGNFPDVLTFKMPSAAIKVSAESAYKITTTKNNPATITSDQAGATPITSAKEGEKVYITAAGTIEQDGQSFEFTQWLITKSDGTDVTNDLLSETEIKNLNTSFNMPAYAVRVIPCYAGFYNITAVGATVEGDIERAVVGTQITVTANLPEGAEFTGWTATEGVEVVSSPENPLVGTFTMPAANVTITANYNYQVTADANTVIKNGNDVVASGTYVAPNTELTITANSVKNMKFKDWTVTGATVDSTTKNPAKFTVSESAVNVTANYSKLLTPIITAKNISIKWKKAANINAKVTSGATLTYKSSNTKVATVDKNGKVKGKKAGKATITISAAAKGNYLAGTKKITVTVKKVAPTIKVQTKKITIKRGKSGKILASVNSKGKLSYKKIMKAKKITIKKNVISIDKSLRKGLYKIKVKVSAAAKGNYNKGSKTVFIKIKVK